MLPANEYFAWAMNLCLVRGGGGGGGGGSGMFVDLIPEDGVIRDLSAAEELVLGQSLERIARARLKGIGTVSRIQCGPRTTPEVFYLGVEHALRQVEAWAQTEREAEEREMAAALLMQSSSTSSSLLYQSDPALLVPPPPLTTAAAAPPPTATTSSTPSLAPTAAATVLVEPSTAAKPPPLPQVAAPQLLSVPPLLQSHVEGGARRPRFAPHVLILQDIDQAPARTLHYVAEMMHCGRLSVPPHNAAAGPQPALATAAAASAATAASASAPTASSSSSAAAAFGFALLEPLDLPRHFLVCASSCRLPTPSPFTSSHAAAATANNTLPDRLLNEFLLRVPICYPSGPPPQSAPAPSPPHALRKPPPVRLTRADFASAMDRGAVYVSPVLMRHVRTVCSKLAQQQQPAAAGAVRGVVMSALTPHAVDSVLAAMRAHAALAQRDFAIPDDFYACAVDVLAHKFVMAESSSSSSSSGGEGEATGAAQDDDEQEPWYQARCLVASTVSSLRAVQ